MNINTKSSIPYLTGLITGILISLALVVMIQIARGPSSIRSQGGSEVLAEIDGTPLTRQGVEAKLAGSLVPVESAEYDLLSKGVDQWMEEELIQIEARAQKTDAKSLYAKEVWSQIQKAAAQDPQARDAEYEKVKKNYLTKLQHKYRAVIYLEKPKGYVPGLGIPTAPPAVPGSKPPAPGVLPPATATFNDLAGRPSMGPENAPITLVEFSDFHCPFCQKVEPTVDQLMKNFPGKIRKVWRHFPLPMHAGAERTHEASECAHEQGKFWDYHAKLFQNIGTPKDDAALVKFAEEVRLDKNKFEACLAGGKYKNAVQQDMAKGKEVGVQGTPAAFLNGRLMTGAQPYENFSNMVESLLDPSKAARLLAAAPGPGQPQPQQPPPPTPKNVPFNDLEGRPSVGPKNAAITLVEFSDFFCPFCQRVEPTVEQLMKNYEGKIRKVWRHFPLPFHTGADRAHEASECAHEQGKFWNYHAKLFENVGAAKDDVGLIQLAEEAKLNKKKFEACLTSGKYKELVKKEIAAGSQYGVRGTPAVFVNGDMVSGAQPYEAFDGVVKTKLSEKG